MDLLHSPVLTDCREKARIPAWCDRILRKGSKLKQIDYATAPLRFSDHRPVYATFECTISNVDERRKEELSRTLYEKRKQSIAGSSAAMEHIDEDVVGYRSVAAGLPPASSNRRKWWLDNGTTRSKTHHVHSGVTDQHLRSSCSLAGRPTNEHGPQPGPTVEPICPN